MVERINGSPVGQPRRIDSGNASQKAEDSKDVTTSANPASSAETSLLERARAGIDASDGVDRQKVEAIKTAIRNGEFSIDADQVARAFIDLELQTNPA